VGYAYSVYAVDLKKLRKRPLREKKWFGALRNAEAEEWKRADEWFDDAIVQRGAPTRARAAWELVFETPSQKKHGFQYGYALEALCRAFGNRVDDASLTWFDETLDPLLAKARCPSTKTLLGSGVYPMAIPPPADFPEIGTVTPAGCVAGIRAMAKIEPLVAKGDDDALMVVREVRGWFERAKAHKRGLVWFVY
jgi:hypothetical protein